MGLSALFGSKGRTEERTQGLIDEKTRGLGEGNKHRPTDKKTKQKTTDRLTEETRTCGLV